MSSINAAQQPVNPNQLQNLDKWAQWQINEAGKVDGGDAGTIQSGDSYIMSQLADGDMTAAQAKELLLMNGGAMRQDSNGALPINPKGSNPYSEANMFRDFGAQYAQFDGGQSPLDLLDGYQQRPPWYG